MYRHPRRFTSFILLLLLLAAASAWGSELLSVAIKNAGVRAQPRIFAKKLTSLAYGDQVEVIGSQKAWYQVRLTDGRSGWLQQTALTSDDLQLSAGKRRVNTGASDEELTLAGKGFNNEVEQKFKQRNQYLDFTWVDRMETFAPSDRELQSFLRNGKLNDGGRYDR
ncbi:MAG: hypothetical protein C0624_03925 [Desulfuromonas sp.]|nr:MAG: hypothetical protein C0624_03925 [Desulfuromonas sp.]